MRTIQNYFEWLSEQEDRINFSYELLKLLRDNKEKIDIRDVRELLHLGADPNYKMLGHTDEERIDRIIKAAQEEEWELTEVPRVQIYKMATLAYPIFHSNPDVLEVLFEYGADPNLDFSDVALASGATTAFAYAVRQARKTFLSNPNNTSRMKIIDLFIKNGADVNVLDSYGNTLLHLAVKDSNFDIIPKLIEIGVNPRHKNKSGKLPYQMINPWNEYYINGEPVNGSHAMDIVKDMLEKS